MTWTWVHAVVLLPCAALSVLLGAPLTRAVLTWASRRPHDGAREEPSAQAHATPGPTSPAATNALRGGTWIGYLERLAITASIVAGYPAAIAVVVAVKGLGRFPELRDNPAASERFVIGTLASFVWAALCGVLGLAVSEALT